MERVKGGDKVILRAGEVGGCGRFEGHSGGNARLGGTLAGLLNRRVVVVESGDLRSRIGLTEQQGRSAVPATHVGHLRAVPQLLLNPIQGRAPRVETLRQGAGVCARVTCRPAAQELLARGLLRTTASTGQLSADAGGLVQPHGSDVGLVEDDDVGGREVPLTL